MIFYDCNTAPSPRRARMFIAEKGIEIETRNIDLSKGEQLGPDYLAVNPRATVPALVTQGGQVLGENIAIAAYLEALFPEPPLMGEGAEEKGSVMMWNAMSEFQGGWAVAEALRNAHPAMKDRALPGPESYRQIPELAERGHARLNVFFDLLEQRLQESPYLASGRFTLADITAFVFCDFARVVRRAIPEENGATRDWFARISERDSARR
ncbi:glutathione S-transferase family protein [Thiosulfatihalobacter marinus]|jgi:glutathione S-transferase|uniref:glutathione S-transferase family protein n=1 Tax=Thiosulfatihalobacter marinus TaxID=2792481 RepID=UPI0018D63D4F|nr:glutathione S-transferase [Thiosulfatihalobacter marinus]